MYTFLYGNIQHRGYAYLCSKPDFFEDIKRTQALNNIIRYDITCKHGELALEQHQSFQMLTSDLNSGIAPTSLFPAQRQTATADMPRAICVQTRMAISTAPIF